VPILVIAEKGFHKIYRSFAKGDDQLLECTPSESQEFISKCQADLVLLDCSSDVGNGISTLKDIKAKYPAVPVIFLAELGSEEVVLKAFKSGARDFFSKPVNLTELQETVDGILSVKKSAVERRRPFKTAGPLRKDPLKILTTSHPVNIINVVRYIEDNLAGPLSLDELAAKADISKYHFCRFFKKHVGMTPMRYLISRRIAKARELLKKEDLPISAIAPAVGFNDMSSFTVQFKRFSGKTPIKYKLSRKKVRKKIKEKIKQKGQRPAKKKIFSKKQKSLKK
jgi:YesN/AraC family two-component response regulator